MSYTSMIGQNIPYSASLVIPSSNTATGQGNKGSAAKATVSVPQTSSVLDAGNGKYQTYDGKVIVPDLNMPSYAGIYMPFKVIDLPVLKPNREIDPNKGKSAAPVSISWDSWKMHLPAGKVTMGIVLDAILGTSTAKADIPCTAGASALDLEPLMAFSQNNDVLIPTTEPRPKLPVMTRVAGAVGGQTHWLAQDNKSIFFGHPAFTDNAEKERLFNTYFNNESKYQKLFLINKVLGALYTEGANKALVVPADPYRLVNNFQRLCQSNAIYAIFYGTGGARPKFIPVTVDGKVGPQTVRAMIFVYELGILAVEFGIVDSFKDYVDAFANPAKFRTVVVQEFQRFIKNNQAVRARLTQLGVAVATIPESGIIKEATGEAIINMFKLWKNCELVKSDLANVAAKKITIRDVITPAVAAKFSSLPAIVEAKKILFCLKDNDGNKYYKTSVEGFDGTWVVNDPFDQGLKKLLNTGQIDYRSAQKLLDLAKSRMDEIENMLQLKDPNQAWKEIPSGTRNELLKNVQKIRATDVRPDGTTISEADKLYQIESEVVREINNEIARILAARLAAINGKLTSLLNNLRELIENYLRPAVTEAINIDILKRGTIPEYKSILDKITPAKANKRASLSLDKNKVGDNNLTITTYKKINLAGTRIADVIKAFESIEQELTTVEPQFKTQLAPFLENHRLSFEAEVERLRLALGGRIETLKTEAARRAKPQAQKTLAFEMGDSDVVTKKEKLEVGAPRTDLYYLDFVKVELSEKDYQAMTADEFKKIKDIRKYLAFCTSVLADRKNNAALLKDAERIFEAKIKKILANREEILAANQVDVLNPMYFSDCLTAEIEGRILSLAGLALAQAYCEQPVQASVRPPRPGQAAQPAPLPQPRVNIVSDDRDADGFLRGVPAAMIKELP